MFLSTRDRGGAESRRRRKKKNLSKGKRKYIYEQVAAGLALVTMGYDDSGWANCYHTATCVKKNGLHHSVGR